MVDESTAVDEHEQTRAVAAILREAPKYHIGWSRRDKYVVFERHIKALHLPAADEANALARLREVLGINE